MYFLDDKNLYNKFILLHEGYSYLFHLFYESFIPDRYTKWCCAKIGCNALLILDTWGNSRVCTSAKLIGFHEHLPKDEFAYQVFLTEMKGIKE